MPKILQGKVLSNKMKGTVVVEVSQLLPHPLYKKLLKRTKKYKVDSKEKKLEVGQTIKIIETRPISKDKHFVLLTDEKKQAQAKDRRITGSKEKKA